jgi:hypothetical protein
MFLIHLRLNTKVISRTATPGRNLQTKQIFADYLESLDKKSILTFFPYPSPQPTLLKMLAVDYVSLMLTDMFVWYVRSIQVVFKLLIGN